MPSTPRPLHIVLGSRGPDKAFLDKVVRRSRRSKTWVVPSRAAVGDDLVIYVVGHGFYATGTIDGAPRRRKDWKNRFGAALRNLRPIAPPISLATIQRSVPQLAWANYPRSITTPEPRVADRLRKLIADRRANGMERVHADRMDSLNLAELRAVALGSASRALKACSANVVRRVRSQAIARYVLRRAEGFCEGCARRAPFVATDGRPYLEPHHTTRVADGGPDHPEHVIALCPTCHRRAHSGWDRHRFNERLKKKVKAIERD